MLGKYKREEIKMEGTVTISIKDFEMLREKAELCDDICAIVQEADLNNHADAMGALECIYQEINETSY